MITLEEHLCRSIWKHVEEVQERYKKRLLTMMQVREFVFWIEHLHSQALARQIHPDRIYLHVLGGSVPSQYANNYSATTTKLTLFSGKICCERTEAPIYKNQSLSFVGGITGEGGIKVEPLYNNR